MIRNFKILAIVLLFNFYSVLASNNKNIRFSAVPTALYCLNGQDVTLFVDNNEAGYLSYIELPILKWYIIYDFYIENQYRNKGYGKQLFKKVLSKINAQGASKVFVQPGPFELINDDFVAIQGAEREIRIKKLINFYQSFGFHLVNNKYVSKFLSLIYKVLDIQEDPNFLMVHTIQKDSKKWENHLQLPWPTLSWIILFFNGVWLFLLMLISLFFIL